MPEDDDVAEEQDDAEMNVMSRARMQELYDDDNDDEGAFDPTGADLEEEYVGCL